MLVGLGRLVWLLAIQDWLTWTKGSCEGPGEGTISPLHLSAGWHSLADITGSWNSSSWSSWMSSFLGMMLAPSLLPLPGSPVSLLKQCYHASRVSKFHFVPEFHWLCCCVDCCNQSYCWEGHPSYPIPCGYSSMVKSLKTMRNCGNGCIFHSTDFWWEKVDRLQKLFTSLKKKISRFYWFSSEPWTLFTRSSWEQVFQGSLKFVKFARKTLLQGTQ